MRLYRRALLSTLAGMVTTSYVELFDSNFYAQNTVQLENRCLVVQAQEDMVVDVVIQAVEIAA